MWQEIGEEIGDGVDLLTFAEGMKRSETDVATKSQQVNTVPSLSSLSLLFLAFLAGCGARTGLLMEEMDSGSIVEDADLAPLDSDIEEVFDGDAPEDSGPDVYVLDGDLPELEVGSRVEVSRNHTCIIDENLEVLCWGANYQGSVGDGTTEARPSPVRVEGVQDVVQLALGFTHSCALHADGIVTCWGAVGQMWPPGTFNHGIPWEVEGMNGVVSIGSGFSHNCAIRIDGSVWCWGDYGFTTRDGHNCSSSGLRGPTRVEGLGRAVQVDGGIGHGCALLDDGTVWCWGCNNRGQLGDGTEDDRVDPVQVVGLDDIVLISMEDSASCALDRGGVLWCWGGNSGNLADGTEIDRPTPTRALGVVGEIEAIEIGTYTMCVLSSGRVYCSGSLPVTTVPSGGCQGSRASTTLEQYTELDNVTDFGSSGWHFCALSDDDNVRCWGCNSSGQLGDGTYQYIEDPAVVWPVD